MQDVICSSSSNTVDSILAEKFILINFTLKHLPQLKGAIALGHQLCNNSNPEFSSVCKQLQRMHKVKDAMEKYVSTL